MSAMNLLYLLLAAMLQSSTDGLASQPALRKPATTLSTEIVTLEELKQRTSSGEFVPVPSQLLKDLQARLSKSELPLEISRRPQIQDAQYSATLTGTRLENGIVDFRFYPDSDTRRVGPLQIGSTSLQQLKLRDDQGPVALGSDASRRLFVLRPGLPEKLSGTWAAEGLVAGDVVTFRLELPEATTSRIELLTAPETQVTSTGSLVLGPEVSDSQMKWILLPGDTSRLSFSCRNPPKAGVQGPLVPTGFVVSHTVASDALISRWTIGLPSAIGRNTEFIARLPENVRVSEIVLEDKRSIEWSVAGEERQQFLRMIVPETTSATTLSVSAESVLPLSETWNLPMLSLSSWQSEDRQHRGLIMTPISQISVVLPASVELDEWILVGIHERDMVTRPDKSREYQLIQFLPEASAVVRASTTQPIVSDSVVTLLEPAGRLATVRCLVNVRCEGASAVELKWPIATGWQVLAARYASNSRALFFEFSNLKAEATAGTVTVHLPEALEAGTSRIIEIQLQQADSTDQQSLKLPLQTTPGVDRSKSFVIFPPRFSLSSDLQRFWSAGRRILTTDEVLQQVPWIPQSRVVPGMQAFESGDSGLLTTPVAADPGEAEDQSIQLEHAIRVADGLIVENSRLVWPAAATPEEPLSVVVPTNSSAEIRWSVDGEPVAAKRIDDPDLTSEWRRWAIPISNRVSDSSMVIRCESRQPVKPDFIATIPVPESKLPLQSTLQLFSSAEGLLSADRLIAQSKPRSAEEENPSTFWKVPDGLIPVQIKVRENPRIQSGQTIDVQMLHLIGEQNGGLLREVLAVANVSRSAGQNSLSLSLPENTRPLVLVNGHRVQLQVTPGGFSIPLPLSSVDCQVLLKWTEPARPSEKITGERVLPRLFLSELAVPQCTHHVLIDPGLELQAPDNVCAASEPTDIYRILDRLLVNASADEPSVRAWESPSIPSEVRQFVIRWQLAVVQGWNSQTLIDSVVAANPVVVEVTQLRRQLAIATGTFLLLVAGSIGLRHFAIQHRVVMAMLAFVFLALSLSGQSQVLSAAFRGAFWGLSLGMTIVMLSRWNRLRSPHGILFLKRTSGVMIWLFLVTRGLASPQASTETTPTANQAPSSEAYPAVLIPKELLPGGEIVYVRRSLMEAWRIREAGEQLKSPAAVVTSLHSRILAESVDSVELQLSLGVAAVSSHEEAAFRIPLQGSRLVDCSVDGVKVLAEPDGVDSIRVKIPASALVRSRSLAGIGKDSSVPDSSRNTAVDPGPLAAFAFHRIECRMRPLTLRQPSGVQFRLPGLPCPTATVEVICPADLYSSARAQTPEGVVQWNPSSGLIPLNSLAMSDGIDFRLLQAGIERGSPQLANVEILAIDETVSGQQVLNCICRFSRWNMLTPEVRYRVPQGFRLASVSATTGADVVTDLLWSVKDQNATVQLPAGVTNEFVLSLQLVNLTPATALSQTVPVSELRQFADCVVSPGVLLAVKANPVFSVLPLEVPQVVNVSFLELQAAWGQWLRRTDSVFRIPNGVPSCVVRLTPKNSFNEVSISQDVSIHEDRIDWKCQVDIETSVLPVFRHRLQIRSDIVVTDVKVVAGEANRLDSWHRRGDQLVIQLKEGTTGLHGITITGTQMLRPDDSRITLQSLHLQNAQIPEPSITITDQDGLGLVFEKLGGAVPERIQTGDLLPPGMPVRLQVVDENDPIVLQRIRPVEPTGSIVAIRTFDQVAFVLHISQWSGNLGPLHMSFSEKAEFIREPVVVADGIQLPLVREANEFVGGQDVVKSLFDRPEFTVTWTMPIHEKLVSENAATFPWPHILDEIRWSGIQLVPLDALPGSLEQTSTSNSVPGWLKNAALTAGIDLTIQKTGLTSLSLDSSLLPNAVIIPIHSAPERASSEAGRDVVAVSDTIVWCRIGESAVGETLFMLFASKTPAKCSVRIPEEVVVTEIESREFTRWEDAARENILIELNQPVTVVKTRWLSRQMKDEFTSSRLELFSPFPADYVTHRTLTIVSEDGQLLIAGSPERLTASALFDLHRSEIDLGLNHAKATGSMSAERVFEQFPSQDTLSQELSDSRASFLQRFRASGRTDRSSAICRPADSEMVVATIRPHMKMATALSFIVGFLVLTVAAFAKNVVAASVTLPTDPLRRASVTVSAEFPRADSVGSKSAVGQTPPSTHSSPVNQPDRTPSSVDRKS